MTDKNNETKKAKKQGPIRTGAVIPLIIFIVLVVGFNILFLDVSIKKSIEFIGGKANGAEVNVDSVKTSFSDLSISVKRIQFTNKEIPTHNRFEIGEFNFQMLWDALLRGKIVIDRSNLNHILINTKRASKGFVPPPPKQESASSKKTKEVLGKAKKEFDGNVFGDIAGVLSGDSVGDTKGKFEGELASKKRLTSLNAEIDQKQKEIDQSLKGLPTEKDFTSLKSRFNAIAWKDLGNIAKAPKILKEADQLKKDIEKANKAINDASKKVDSSLKFIDSSYKEVQGLVDQDIANISKRMNLPSLDPKTIAKMLFGNELLDKITELKKYQDMASEYMPKKKGKLEAPIKKPRGKGRDYRFGTPNSYPLFWLKLASIDSKNDQGIVKGKIENITTNQRQIGKLTTGQINADFPGENVRDIVSHLEIDHRDNPVLRMDATIGSFPVAGKALSDSKDVTFIIKQANTKSEMKATLTPENVDMTLNNSLTNITYETKAKSPQVQEVLTDVSSKTKTLTLDAKGKGKWDSIKFDIKSNLAQAIQNSVQSLVQEKINKAKAKIKADVEKQIAGTKKQIDDKVASLKGQYDKQLNQGKAQLAKIQDDLDSTKKKAEKDAKGGTEKKLKSLFKGIKL